MPSTDDEISGKCLNPRQRIHNCATNQNTATSLQSKRPRLYAKARAASQPNPTTGQEVCACVKISTPRNFNGKASGKLQWIQNCSIFGFEYSPSENSCVLIHRARFCCVSCVCVCACVCVCVCVCVHDDEANTWGNTG
jgi:hypothetical protein